MEQNHLYIAGSLQAAWQQKDFDLLYSVLSNNISWQYDPFEAELTSAEAVVDHWQDDLFNQQDIVVDIKLLDSIKERGYYHFHANWLDNGGEAFELSGMFVIALNDNGKILSFKQWWNAK